MADDDAREILALRDYRVGLEDLVDEVAFIIANNMMLDGFIAWNEACKPVACAFAFVSQLPRVCNVVVFGAKDGGRAGLETYDELIRRIPEFARQFDIRVVQVPVWEGHKVARKLIARVGGKEVFEYGPIGRDGERFVHVIWEI
jgi:hypothetical protein